MQKINTALLSFGMSGWVFHEPFITIHPGFEFYAVLERTKNLAAVKHPHIITYRNIEDLLKDDSIELVIVNTPNTTHFEYTKMALNAGKHVVVEKPFTTTVEQATELIELAQNKGKVLTVFQNRRWDSDFKTVQSIIKEQLLGDIIEAEIHYDRYNPQLSVKTHKETPQAGVGTIYDLGPHIIDQALHLFGMPLAVFADLESLRPGSRIDDYFEILLYYPALRVRIKASYLVREPLPAYVIHGTKGSFLKYRADVQEARLQAHESPAAQDWGVEPAEARGLLHTEVGGEIIKEHFPTLPGNYLSFYNGLYDTIRNNQPVPVSPQDAKNIIQIIELAIASSKEKRVIQVANSK